MKIDRFLADTPQQMLYAMRLGKTVFVTRGRQEKRARHILHLVRDGEVDTYFGSPYIWMKMRELAGANADRLPPSLRNVLLGGAPVTADFLSALRGWLHDDTQLLMLYGLTETGVVCTARSEDKLNWKGQGDLVGIPLDGIDIDIVDPDKNAIGEVVVHSPSLYAGYLGEKQRSPEEGLHTGDLGRLMKMNDRPMLVLAGRAKDMIIRRGVNIYPGVLEPVIRSFRDEHGPLMQQCALVGLWNEARQDEDVVLCVERGSGRPSLQVGELHRRVSIEVGPDGAPDHILMVDIIPVTGRQNKIDRNTLRTLAISGMMIGNKVSRIDKTDWRWLPAAQVPFGYRAFFKKSRILLKKEQAPFRVLTQTAFRLVFHAINQVSWFCDELIRFRWRQTQLQGPLFILGHQRSGTTFLHRLLTNDKVNFRALKLHEMLFPAITFQSMLGNLVTMDGLLGGICRGGFNRLQTRLFGSLDDIHRIRFDEIEEDEFALWTIYASAMCVNDAPSTAVVPELDELRHFHEWPRQRQVEALGWYRACLLKKVYRTSIDLAHNIPWVVSKNPAFTKLITFLRCVFPAARFVYLVRDPVETISSRLSLVREIWRRRCPGFQQLTAEQVEVILQDSIYTYLAAERDLRLIPADQWLIVTYSELINNPREITERIYDHLDLPNPKCFNLQVPDNTVTKRKKSSTSHTYRLDEFGLDESRVRQALSVVFDRYEFR